jgi:hypothetical protein
LIDTFQFGDGDALAFPTMTGAGRYHIHCCGGVENEHAGEETRPGFIKKRKRKKTAGTLEK